MEMIDESKRDVASHAFLWKHIFGVMDSLVLKCAIKLDILDVIHGAPRPVTLAELAASLPVTCTDLSMLRRVMRYLVCMDIVISQTCDGASESYALAPASKFLVKGERMSLASIVLLNLDENFLSAVHDLDAVLVGTKPMISTYKKVKSESLYDHLSGNPELNKVFNQAMVGKSLITIARAMDVCPKLFLGIQSLVDVGGGKGMVAREILKKFPHIHCTVLDLHQVVEGLPEHPGITYLVGDMFEYIPNSDAVLLMSQLHTWNDEQCLKILKRCKEAMPRETCKLIIIDPVIEREEEDAADAEEVELKKARIVVDMLIMAISEGKERTEKEWRKLLLKAGFHGCKITSIKTLQHVIEAYPC